MASWWNFGGKPKGEEEGPPNVGVHNAGASSTSSKRFKPMNSAFRRGVQYNMKIIIRGDVMTGKSTMFSRLQGASFVQNYETTPQIQVANIPWSYNDSNDMVKIEIWDVVDKGINPNVPKANAGLKLDNKATSKPVPVSTDFDPSNLTLDARTVEVYRNTHGVILVFDITKLWTFEYVTRELEFVPAAMSVLVVGNFSDLASQRVVSLLAIHKALFRENQRRMHDKGSMRTQLVRYMEASMLTGFGLKFIHRWLGVPFLELHTETLRAQYETKCAELLDLMTDLDMSDEVPKEFKRRRGSGNFHEPEEDRVDQQHNEMERKWNKDGIGKMDAMYMDGEEDFSSSPRSAASTRAIPPRSPALQSSEYPSQSLPSETLVIPRAITAFDAGSSIEDDFFDDLPAQSTQSIPGLRVSATRDDDDDFVGSNALVASDEDVEFEAPMHPGGHDDDDDDDDDDNTFRPTVGAYRSELSSLWNTSDLPPSRYPITAMPYSSAQTVPSDSESDNDPDDEYAAMTPSLSTARQGRSLFDPDESTRGFGGAGFYRNNEGGEGFASPAGGGYEEMSDPWATGRRQSSGSGKGGIFEYATETSSSVMGGSHWSSITSPQQAVSFGSEGSLKEEGVEARKKKSKKKSKEKEGDEGGKKDKSSKKAKDIEGGEKKKKKKKKNADYENF